MEVKKFPELVGVMLEVFCVSDRKDFFLFLTAIQDIFI